MSASTCRLEADFDPTPASRDLLEGAAPAPYFRHKVLLERMAGIILLLPALPCIALTILLMRLTSKGPGIFRQTRVGRNGKTFVMYKIRTMQVNAEALTGPIWTQTNDPRITPVGRLIRALHLDEFPQLINVARGEMGLIGPRPERPEFTQQLALKIPGYLDRLTVLPGITGLAQINLPPDSDLDSVRRKLILDLQYIEQCSAWLDARIYLCTLARLLGIRGLLPSKAAGIYREVILPETTLHDKLSRAAAVGTNGHDEGEHLGNGHAKNGFQLDPANFSKSQDSASIARRRPR